MVSPVLLSPPGDTSNIGARQSNKAQSQPAGELEAPGPHTEVKINCEEGPYGLARAWISGKPGPGPLGADMMTLPRMTSHGETDPDTGLMPQFTPRMSAENRVPALPTRGLVIPRVGQESMTGDPARALTRNLRLIRKTAWVPSCWLTRSVRNGTRR